MEFEIPQEKHKILFQEYVHEANQNGETVIHGDGGCSLHECFEEWLGFDKDLREETNIPNGYVGATTYFVIDDDKMVGTVNIRHSLNEELLKWGGHIGYSVSVKRRRQKVATTILNFSIKECRHMGIKDILVTCHKDNIASKKTIEKCGGQLENEIEINDEKILRYWIKEK